MLKKLLNAINFPKYQVKGILVLFSLLTISLIVYMFAPVIFPNNDALLDKKFLQFKEAAVSFNKNLDSISQPIVNKNTKHQQTNIYRNKNKQLIKNNLYDKKNIKTIEINSSSKDDLMSIPYIGEIFSTRIIKYRKMLGGFYSKEQFKEVYNINEEALNNLYKHTHIDTNLIRKININNLASKEIWKIPYLNYSQKKILFLFIKNKGEINNLEELYNIHGIDKNLITKIIPYITKN